MKALKVLDQSIYKSARSNPIELFSTILKAEIIANLKLKYEKAAQTASD